MTVDDIDSRGRRAAAAAHASVAPLVHAATGRRQWRRTPAVRSSGARSAVAVALTVLVPLLVVGALRFTTPTKLSTGGSPAGQSRPPSTLPAPPAAQGPAGLVEAPISSGTASDGRRWVLFAGGPGGGLCLGLEIGAGSMRTDTCAADAGPAAPDPYRPWFHNDTRTRPFVFGRAADDVVSVIVEEASTGGSNPVPLIRGSGGAFYVVELPDRKKPDAVIGFRADGTLVRYPVP